MNKDDFQTITIIACVSVYLLALWSVWDTSNPIGSILLALIPGFLGSFLVVLALEIAFKEGKSPISKAVVFFGTLGVFAFILYATH